MTWFFKTFPFFLIYETLGQYTNRFVLEIERRDVGHVKNIAKRYNLLLKRKVIPNYYLFLKTDMPCESENKLENEIIERFIEEANGQVKSVTQQFLRRRLYEIPKLPKERKQEKNLDTTPDRITTKVWKSIELLSIHKTLLLDFLRKLKLSLHFKTIEEDATLFSALDSRNKRSIRDTEQDQSPVCRYGDGSRSKAACKNDRGTMQTTQIPSRLDTKQSCHHRNLQLNDNEAYDNEVIDSDIGPSVGHSLGPAVHHFHIAKVGIIFTVVVVMSGSVYLTLFGVRLVRVIC